MVDVSHRRDIAAGLRATLTLPMCLLAQLENSGQRPSVGNLSRAHMGLV